jgi:hypothetical protein
MHMLQAICFILSSNRLLLLCQREVPRENTRQLTVAHNGLTVGGHYQCRLYSAQALGKLCSHGQNKILGRPLNEKTTECVDRVSVTSCTPHGTVDQHKRTVLHYITTE